MYQGLAIAGTPPARREGIRLHPPGHPSASPCRFTSPLRLKKVASSKQSNTVAVFSMEFLRASASFSFMRAFEQAHRQQVSIGAEPLASSVLPSCLLWHLP